MRFAPGRRSPLHLAAVVAALGIALPAASASAATPADATPTTLPQLPDQIASSLGCPPWYGIPNPATGCTPYWGIPSGVLMQPFWTLAPLA
jgi:hypothetical protein